MTAPRDEDQYYGVEVSGWNSKENFFVEQTSLEWTPEGLKSVRLRTDLRAGTIVFLRLLQRGPEVNQLPIAYQATELSPRARDGRIRVCLQQLHPREKRYPATQQELSAAGVPVGI
jgi:hypothetical protein